MPTWGPKDLHFDDKPPRKIATDSIVGRSFSCAAPLRPGSSETAAVFGFDPCCFGCCSGGLSRNVYWPNGGRRRGNHRVAIIQRSRTAQLLWV